MKKAALAALAGALSLAPLNAQLPATVPAATAPATDFSYSPVSPGSWGYRATASGSEATFVDTTGTRRLTIGCSRATRQLLVSRASAAPAATVQIWTSSGSRQLPARFDQPGQRVTAQTTSADPLLDSLAFSRGRIAVMMPGSPPLVVPSGAEISSVVEDCRA